MATLIPENNGIAKTVDKYRNSRKIQWTCIAESVVWYWSQSEGLFSKNVLNIMDVYEHTNGEDSESRFLAKLLEGPLPANSEDLGSYEFKISETGTAISYLLSLAPVTVEQLVTLIEANGGRAGVARLQRAKTLGAAQSSQNASMNNGAATQPSNTQNFRWLTRKKEPAIGIMTVTKGWKIEIAREGATIKAETNATSDLLTIMVSDGEA